MLPPDSAFSSAMAGITAAAAKACSHRRLPISDFNMGSAPS
jgi:hypothetical protein